MSKRNYLILLFLAIVVYAINLSIDIMDIDAAQYAEMSWEMFITKDFLHLYCFGQGNLDKPPLLFWLGALSYYIFGIGTASYKLSSVFFALVGVYSTYRFAKLFYDRQTALKASLILATTQALFLITNDVRTDTILMGAVIFSIWQLAAYLQNGTTLNLLAGSFGVGLAMLAKGPMGLMVPALAFIPQIALQKKWDKVFDRRVILFFVIVGMMLVPMCIGLYQQWGTEGLKFYFWTQSFGRVLGKTQWNNHPDPLFLVHTTLWAFAPWSLFLFAGIISGWVQLIKNKFRIQPGTGVISLFGFTLVALILIGSKYQLPHYIFVIYPLGAVIAARCLKEIKSWNTLKPLMTIVQLILLVSIIAVSCLLQYCFKGIEPLSLICLAGLYPLGIWFAVKLNGPVKDYRAIISYFTHHARNIYRNALGKSSWWSPKVAVAFDIVHRNIFNLSAIVIIVFNFLMSAFYYPEILKYQPGDDFGRYIKGHVSHNNNFIIYDDYVTHLSLIFYAQHVPAYELIGKENMRKVLNEKKKCIVLTGPSGISALNEDHVSYKIIQERWAFNVSSLTLPFLNPATRNSVCCKVYLLEATI